MRTRTRRNSAAHSQENEPCARLFSGPLPCQPEHWSLEAGSALSSRVTPFKRALSIAGIRNESERSILDKVPDGFVHTLTAVGGAGEVLKVVKAKGETYVDLPNVKFPVRRDGSFEYILGGAEGRQTLRLNGAIALDGSEPRISNG